MKSRIARLLLVTMMPFAGCNLFNPPENPAVVLEGTWQVVFDEPGDLEGFDIRVTFNAEGSLVEITAEAPEGGTASLDVDDATTSEVDGDQVTVSIPAAGGARAFEGTLSEEQDSIDGALSQELELPSGDLEVTLPTSELTLQRLES